MTGFKVLPSRITAGEGLLSPLDIDGRHTVLRIYGRPLTVVLSVARRGVFLCAVPLKYLSAAAAGEDTLWCDGLWHVL